MSGVRSIAPGVIRIPTGIANSYIIGTRRSWTLVDCGSAGYFRKIRDVADDRYGPEARPQAIVLTHGHFDHAGSAAELADYWDVPIYGHRLELPFVRGEQYPPPDPTVGGFMAQMIRFMPTKSYDFGSRVRELRVGQEPPGMLGWQTYETPGHTAGHISFYRPEDGTLIAGDAFTTIDQDNPVGLISRKPQIRRPPAYYTTDWKSAHQSVRRLASLDPQIIGAGHGEPMSGPEAGWQLRQLAENWETYAPDYGRYVREPARSDEQGLTHVPPPVADHVPIIAGAAALGALATIMGAMARRKKAA